MSTDSWWAEPRFSRQTALVMGVLAFIAGALLL